MAKKAKSADMDVKETKKKTSAGSSAKKEASASKSKDTKNKKASSGSGKVRKYFKDLKSEFKKVVWPSKQQVFNNTLVVLVTMIVLGIFIGGLDTLMLKALQWVVSNS